MLRTLSLCMLLAALASCAPANHSTAPRLGRLAGSILDPGGAPANGALVLAYYVPDPLEPGALGEADANGHFDFGEVPTGEWVVAANHGDAWAAAETLFLPSTTSSMRLLTAGAIRGRARLQGATSHANTIVITLLGIAWGESDSTGAFLVGGVARGRWLAFYTHTAYRDTSATFTMPAAGDTITIPDMLLVPGTFPRPIARAAPPTR